MGLFAGIITALSSAFSVYSSYQNQKANKKAARAAEAAADGEAARKRRELDRLRGSQRVAYARAGIKLDGTPTAVIDDSQDQGQMDINLIKMKGAQQADYYNSAAKQAGMDMAIGGLNTVDNVFTPNKSGVSLASRIWP